MAKFAFIDGKFHIMDATDTDVQLTFDEVNDFLYWFHLARNEYYKAQEEPFEYDVWSEFACSGFHDSVCMTCGEGMSADHKCRGLEE